MFDGDYDDTAARYQLSSIDAVREAALIMYGRFAAAISGFDRDDNKAKQQHCYLSKEETENIVQKHAVIDEHFYAIGGDTEQKAVQTIDDMMTELCDAIMGNVVSAGVKQEYFEQAFDAHRNDFVFSITQKGAALAAQLRDEADGENV
jgi:hypothetical protein